MKTTQFIVQQNLWGNWHEWGRFVSEDGAREAIATALSRGILQGSKLPSRIIKRETETTETVVE